MIDDDRTKPGPYPAKLLVEIEAHCDRFEDEWKQGGHPNIDEVLSTVDVHVREVLTRELLAIEFEQRLAKGLPVDRDHYEKRFPKETAFISQLIAASPTTQSSGSISQLANRAAPQTIGNYELCEKIAEGGMGTIFRAEHRMIEREVAIKIIRPSLAADPVLASRFLAEAQSCVILDHPNIVRTYDVSSDAGMLYITMELLDGVNLAEYVRQYGPLQIDVAVRLMRQAALALTFAHAKGILHRDIKPQNMMVTRDGELKLLDLGLSKNLPPKNKNHAGATDAANLNQYRDATEPNAEGERHRTQGFMGTLAFASPEQIEQPANVDFRSDIYSLGCSFYFMLSGEIAHSGNSTSEIVTRHLGANFEPLSAIRPDTPAHISRIISRMMLIDPRQRYQSAAELLGELDQLAAQPIEVSIKSHYARFDGTNIIALFVNATNLSSTSATVITHVWLDFATQIQVDNPDRRLPIRLEPQDTWETWIELARIPTDLVDGSHSAVRVRLSDGRVLTSTFNKDVPMSGDVPGGHLTPLRSPEFGP